jgi:hypothetical protein
MADDKGAKLQTDVANAEREMLKLKQQINKHQAIPKSNTGETQNLGNAPTPEPAEPTVNEPGYVIFQNPEPKAAASSGSGESHSSTPPHRPAGRG